MWLIKIVFDWEALAAIASPVPHHSLWSTEPGAFPASVTFVWILPLIHFTCVPCSPQRLEAEPTWGSMSIHPCSNCSNMLVSVCEHLSPSGLNSAPHCLDYFAKLVSVAPFCVNCLVNKLYRFPECVFASPSQTWQMNRPILTQQGSHSLQMKPLVSVSTWYSELDSWWNKAVLLAVYRDALSLEKSAWTNTFGLRGFALPDRLAVAPMASWH